MRALTLAALLAGLPAPASASQTASSAPPASAAPAPARAVDPARFAAAERLVALVVPPEMMQSMLNMPFAATEIGMNMTPAQLGIGVESGLSEADLQRPISEIVASLDPNFRERMQIRNRVTGEVMTGIMREAMPGMYRTMAEFYASALTLEELNGAVAYYSTPGGRRFATAAVNIMQDPAFERLLTELAPRFVQAMTTIEDRVTAASAHLPPNPLVPAADAGAEPAEE